MGKIRLLPDHVASQVAAGEVVERPASVVKELIENACDAGARAVRVEFAAGGKRRIRITDDGHAMDRQDALLAIERHATSKLISADDLHRLSTLGFRGEALPSIASVSRFTLTTRQASAAAATRIEISGGQVTDVSEIGAPTGTKVEVTDLFFNVPARKKFLKGDETEASHILQALYGFALANPQISLNCSRDSREFLSAPAADGLGVRITDLFGPSFYERLQPISPFEEEGISLSGFVGRPGQGRRDRLQQFTLLNGRPIQSPDVAAPLREALRGLVPQGSQPIAILVLKVDPAMVDCNVHPAKREVRFARSDMIRRLVFDTVSAAFATQPERSKVTGRPFPERGLSSIGASQGLNTPSISEAPDPAASFRSEPTQELPVQSPPDLPSTQPASEPLSTATEKRQAWDPNDQHDQLFTPLAPLSGTYYLFESADGLVVLDLRAAAERISFERLLREMEADTAPSQQLLMPAVEELPPREHAWIAQNLSALEQAGFGIECFGGLSIKIDALPAAAGERDALEVLREVASAVRSAGRLPRGHGLLSFLARTVSRMTPPARPGSKQAAGEVVRQLMECEMPYTDAVGRPTIIQFSFPELERKFGRSLSPEN